mmetsp:Transcript_34294/g.86051  ORF Transcript_34294/g.86051 Transcript_34294/m.86051 type:complete len:287 (+) Transcript_34294:478-1338(+)
MCCCWRTFAPTPQRATPTSHTPWRRSPACASLPCASMKSAASWSRCCLLGRACPARHPSSSLPAASSLPSTPLRAQSARQHTCSSSQTWLCWQLHRKKKRRKDSKDEPHLRFTLMAPLTLRTTLTAAPDEEATIPNSFLIKTQNITAATIEEITLHLVAESVEEKGRAMATLSGAIESQRAARKLTPSKGRKLAELTRLRQPTNASAPTVGTELAVSNSVPALHASNHSSPMVAFSSSPVPSKRKEDAQFASPTAALISALHTRKTSSAKTGKIVKATSTSNLKEI